MSKVFTIKEGIPIGIFGFERSQLARQELLRFLGIEHQLVLTNLGNYVANFVENLEDLGFTNFYHVIYDQSDIARHKPSIPASFVESLENVEDVSYTREGFVGVVHYKDDVIEGFTSKKLYRLDPNTGMFILYGSKGVVLEGKVDQQYHEYTVTETGEKFSQWQLIILYLAEHSTQQDIFIIDMLNEYPLQLRKFFQNTNRELFAVTHYNILDPMMKFVYQSWCTNIVASPVLEKELGRDRALFLPPIYIDEVFEKTYSTVKDWCIVGNMSFIKQCEMAIEAFRKIPDSQLTIYGNLPKGITQEQLPPNVHFAGFKAQVPYRNHEGYLSCSMSECFANSAVEASASGLVCLLFDSDLAHRYYASICSDTHLFSNMDELVERLKQYQVEGGYRSSQFSKQYTKEKVLELLKIVFKIND